jgi:phage shock protein PspC (stress-responsive transcriptional regulator)
LIISISKAIVVYFGVKNCCKGKPKWPSALSKNALYVHFFHRFGVLIKQATMQKMKDFLELHAFGVCAALGERLGIASSRIRMWFIYISFLTLGSPVIVYMVLAFVRSIKHYILQGKRNPLKY